MATDGLKQRLPSQTTTSFDDGVVFSSAFDNGNLAKVVKCGGGPFDYRVWVAPDNSGTSYQSKHNAWFYFTVTGLPRGVTLRVTVMNASNHAALYRQDMRPVYHGKTSNHKWCRLRSTVTFTRVEDSPYPQMSFEHPVDTADDVLSFAFTFPYTYTMVQEDMAAVDALEAQANLADPHGIYCCRELLTRSCDGLRVDLVTITSCHGAAPDRAREPGLPGLFPPDHAAGAATAADAPRRALSFPDKEVSGVPPHRLFISRHTTLSFSSPRGHFSSPPPLRPLPPLHQVVFISARVHPGEVPAQHTFKGILGLLLDPHDRQAQALRQRYVFKLIPMLNPGTPTSLSRLSLPCHCRRRLTRRP